VDFYDFTRNFEAQKDRLFGTSVGN
jgi:hypothetical protein